MPEMLSMVIWLFQACVPANLSFHREQVALTKRVSMLGRRRTLPARVMHILTRVMHIHTTYTYTLTRDAHSFAALVAQVATNNSKPNKQTKLNQSLFKTITF